MARQERMVRERVRRDMGMGDSDEEDDGDAAEDAPAGWGRKKSAYYKEGDSEVMPCRAQPVLPCSGADNS